MYLISLIIGGLIFGTTPYYEPDNLPVSKNQIIQKFSDIFPQFKPVDLAGKQLQARLKAAGLTAGLPVFIRIYKEQSELELWLNDNGEYKLLHSYEICNWSGRLGPKLKEGDRQSPEGFYEVTRRQLYPHSRHHLAFNIGFPNAYDRSYARTGTYLMVHGGCSSVGCYAVTDANVDEIYSLVKSAINHGQKSVPIHIFPFRMTRERMTKAASNKWLTFWQELKTGHDLFEKNRFPPSVSQCNGSYHFSGDKNQSAGCQKIAGW